MESKNNMERLVYLLDNPGNTTDYEYMEKQYKSLENLSDGHVILPEYFVKYFADKMPGGFFIYYADNDENIIYANKEVLRLFDCDTIEEFYTLTGKSFKGLVHPDDLENVEQSIKEQIEQSQYDLDYVEYRIISKTGKIRWVADYGHFVSIGNIGDIFYVFISDITEKKIRHIEEKKALQDQINEYYRELEFINKEHLRRLEIIEGLSIEYDSIFYVNLEIDKIKAYRIGDNFKKTFDKENKVINFTGFDSDYIENWVCPEDREIVSGISSSEYIRKKLLSQRTFYVNYRVLKNNRPSYTQLRIVNVGGEKSISQVVLGYRSIDAEIARELKQKQILKDALDNAILANNAKNMFLSNMSHDIRTPMNAILGFTSLAKKYIDDKNKVSEYLNMISKSSDQLLQFLNNILEISKIKSGKINVEENECDILELIQKVQSNIFSAAVSKNIMLFFDISELKHNIVYIDDQKFSQVISYLVDNALKYTKENGRITVMVTEQEDNRSDYAIYRFIVEDNGIGISEDFIEHIFEPFEREENTTLSGIYGIGLGLPIAKNLVEILGGSIDVSSVKGKGSKFTVTIPLRVKENSSNISCNTNSNILVNFSKPKRILVVDDNELNLEIETEVLKDCGFLIDTASNGSIAVEKVSKSKPGYYDLILMDIQMPIMNGYEASRKIRKIENAELSNIPIIAISANTFDEDKKKAFESGMNAHLAKPFDTSDLYKMILSFLETSKIPDVKF